MPPDAVLEEYLNRFFARQSDELRDLVRDQVRRRQHSPISDLWRQREFVWGLLTLHVAAAIELASPDRGASTS